MYAVYRHPVWLRLRPGTAAISHIRLLVPRGGSGARSISLSKGVGFSYTRSGVTHSPDFRCSGFAGELRRRKRCPDRYVNA
jgi:hypothetical protein